MICMSKNKVVTIDDVIVKKAGLDASDMDGEVVMMDIDKGKYYCFNSVGSRVWEIIENPTSVKGIIDILLKEFNVDEKTCEEEVLRFLGMMNNEELFTVL